MRDAFITGVGITRFGKFPDTPIRTLGTSAINDALRDASVTAKDIELVVHANAMGGLLSGQEMTRGQVLTAQTDLVGAPLVNVENACASSSSGLHLALLAIQSGAYDTVLVIGDEQLSAASSRTVLDAMTSAADIERLPEMNRDLTGRDGPVESFFMEVYADETRKYMERSGATQRDIAQVAAKNSAHAALNPNAQFQRARTVDEVLASRAIADPLTTLMCSPLADGAAALVVQSDRRVADRSGAIRIRASVIRTGIPGGGVDSLEARTASAAYSQSGLGPSDIDIIELHDAASPNELIVTEELGLCRTGDAVKLLVSGATSLGGAIPINTSGGLVSRGHPVAATGAAQIHELVTQLRGRAGARQAEGVRVALAENAGGYTHPEPAVCVVTILSKD